MKKLTCNYIAVIVMFILLIVSVNAESREKNDTAEKITYREFIDRVILVLPELKKNKIQVEKAKNTLYGAGSAEDINLTAESGYSKTEESSKGIYTEKKDFSSKVGLSKKIAQTGSTIDVGASYNRTEYGTGSEPYSFPSLYVKFNQSLLKNTFGIVDRYAVNNAKMQYEIAKLKEVETNKTDLNYYKKLYFNWIEYREKLKMLKVSINTAIKLSENIKGKYKSGLVNIADLHGSDAFVLKYRIAYEEIKTDMNIMETELSIFFDEKIKVPEDKEFSEFYSNAASTEYNQVEFNNTTNAEIFRITKKNLRYTYEVSENKLLPQLDLVLQYAKTSQDESFSKAVQNMNSSEYYMGFPLPTRSRIRRVKVKQKRLNSQ